MDELNFPREASRCGMTVVAYFRPVTGIYESLKLGWYWRRLKWAVAAASEAAQGHEANGVHPGSQEYKTLYNEVAKKVQDYSHESGILVDTLKAKLPTLCAIARLANPDAGMPQNRLRSMLGILIASSLGSIGLGALIGLATGMAHWIAHLFA